MVSGQIVDSVWRPINYENRSDHFGIPAGYFDKKLTEHHLLSLAQAEAIRWWFIANADAEGPAKSLCLETRLQEYSLQITHSVKPVAALRGLDSQGRALPDPSSTLEPQP
jgi:hypothetical protein